MLEFPSTNNILICSLMRSRRQGAKPYSWIRGIARERAGLSEALGAIEKALCGIEQANQEFLYGIFGDVQWSNKNKLSDSLLIDLIEHFSQYALGNENVNPDMLGQAYEYLIKHFSDLTNKKAGEFYTPRSVVHQLGLILDPHKCESIYDPACGTGGMLLECVDHLKHNHEDARKLKLYGQEKNPTSSSIARMNMFLHGIEDLEILRGDTLRNPVFFEADVLKTFDCVIANPPFSLQDWGAENWIIDASEQVRVGRAQNFLEPVHVRQIYDWYQALYDQI